MAGLGRTTAAAKSITSAVIALAALVLLATDAALAAPRDSLQGPNRRTAANGPAHKTVHRSAVSTAGSFRRSEFGPAAPFYSRLNDSLATLVVRGTHRSGFRRPLQHRLGRIVDSFADADAARGNTIDACGNSAFPDVSVSVSRCKVFTLPGIGPSKGVRFTLKEPVRLTMKASLQGSSRGNQFWIPLNLFGECPERAGLAALHKLGFGIKTDTNVFVSRVFPPGTYFLALTVYYEWEAPYLSAAAQILPNLNISLCGQVARTICEPVPDIVFPDACSKPLAGFLRPGGYLGQGFSSTPDRSALFRVRVPADSVAAFDFCMPMAATERDGLEPQMVLFNQCPTSARTTLYRLSIGSCGSVLPLGKGTYYLAVSGLRAPAFRFSACISSAPSCSKVPSLSLSNCTHTVRSTFLDFKFVNQDQRLQRAFRFSLPQPATLHVRAPLLGVTILRGCYLDPAHAAVPLTDPYGDPQIGLRRVVLERGNYTIVLSQYSSYSDLETKLAFEFNACALPVSRATATCKAAHVLHTDRCVTGLKSAVSAADDDLWGLMGRSKLFKFELQRRSRVTIRAWSSVASMKEPLLVLTSQCPTATSTDLLERIFDDGSDSPPADIPRTATLPAGVYFLVVSGPAFGAAGAFTLDFCASPFSSEDSLCKKATAAPPKCGGSPVRLSGTFATWNGTGPSPVVGIDLAADSFVSVLSTGDFFPYDSVAIMRECPFQAGAAELDVPNYWEDGNLVPRGRLYLLRQASDPSHEYIELAVCVKPRQSAADKCKAAATPVLSSCGTAENPFEMTLNLNWTRDSVGQVVRLDLSDWTDVNLTAIVPQETCYESRLHVRLYRTNACPFLTADRNMTFNELPVIGEHTTECDTDPYYTGVVYTSLRSGTYQFVITGTGTWRVQLCARHVPPPPKSCTAIQNVTARLCTTATCQTSVTGTTGGGPYEWYQRSVAFYKFTVARHALLTVRPKGLMSINVFSTCPISGPSDPLLEVERTELDEEYEADGSEKPNHTDGKLLVDPGEYYVVAESASSQPIAFELRLSADPCQDAIPLVGGRGCSRPRTVATIDTWFVANRTAEQQSVLVAACTQEDAQVQIFAVCPFRDGVSSAVDYMHQGTICNEDGGCPNSAQAVLGAPGPMYVHVWTPSPAKHSLSLSVLTAADFCRNATKITPSCSRLATVHLDRLLWLSTSQALPGGVVAFSLSRSQRVTIDPLQAATRVSTVLYVFRGCPTSIGFTVPPPNMVGLAELCTEDSGGLRYPVEGPTLCNPPVNVTLGPGTYYVFVVQKIEDASVQRPVVDLSICAK